MRNILKKIIIQVFCSLVIAGIAYLITQSFFSAFILFLILLFLIIIKPTVWVLNKLVQRTNWYKNRVGDGLKFCRQITRNIDICNLGSSSGKYAFFYDKIGLKGENWALAPQTLAYDFRVLKNYFSYLKEGATVLIPLCPFSSCIIDFENEAANHKYYPFLHPILILNYSHETKTKIMRFVNTPLLVSPFKATIRLFRDVSSDDKRVLNEEILEKNANIFINNWKQQFYILDLDAPVSELNKKSLTYNSNLLSEMISFCLDRNLKPVIVIPPVTNVLSSKLSEPFRENYIYSFIKKANIYQIPFLNYLDDEKFDDNNLYLNTYFLNKNGRNLFTKTVLIDLHLINKTLDLKE